MPFGTLKPSLGLAAPPAVPQSLSNASEIASARCQKAPCALATLFFYNPPKLLLGTLKPCLLAAWNRSSASQCLQQSLRASAMPQRLVPEGTICLVPWPHCFFMTLRNWLLAASNAPKVSQRLPQLLLWPSETASWHLETLLRPRSASRTFGHTVFLWPSETDFWQLQMLLRSRSASRNFFYDPPKLLLGAVKPS